MQQPSKPTLSEARKKKEIAKFAEERPSKGDAKQFDKLLGAMTGKKPTDKSS